MIRQTVVQQARAQSSLLNSLLYSSARNAIMVRALCYDLRGGVVYRHLSVRRRGIRRYADCFAEAIEQDRHLRLHNSPRYVVKVVGGGSGVGQSHRNFTRGRALFSRREWLLYP